MAENKNTLSRRDFLRKVGQVGIGLTGASILAACATPTPQVVKETVIVEKRSKKWLRRPSSFPRGSVPRPSA